jgi:hypothetical protein
MRALAALILIMGCMACEAAPASAPTAGAAVRRDIAPAPERGTPGDATATPDLHGMVPAAEADEATRARVRFELRTGDGTQPFIPREWLTIRFEDAAGQRAIPGTGLIPAEEGVFRSAWYVTDTRGRLRGEVLVSYPGGGSERRAIELELDDGRAWEVTLLRPTAQRLVECFSGHGSMVLVTRGHDRCGMMIVWHRTRIDEPIPGHEVATRRTWPGA